VTAWSATGDPVGPAHPVDPQPADQHPPGSSPIVPSPIGSGGPTGPAGPAVRAVTDLAAELRRAQAENRQWRMLAGLLLSGVLLGLAQAGLWVRIAPGEVFRIFTDGGYGLLPTASSFRYAAIAMFCLIGLIMGVLQAVGAWAWRSVRGTITLVGEGLGAGVGALTAYLIGRAMAGGVVPGSVGASPVERIVHAPPVSGSAIVLLVQPAAALVVYTLLAAWSGRADLGRSAAGAGRAGTPADPGSVGSFGPGDRGEPGA